MQVLLGTFVDVRAEAEDLPRARHAVERAIDAVTTVHRTMSFHERESELTRLHQEAWRNPVRVSAGLYRVLRASIALSRASEGVFDPTVGGSHARAGLLPLHDGCPEPDRIACYKHVELLSEHRIRFRVPLLIDLGGIAKGYALDMAMRSMRRAGVHSCSINAGGDMCVFSARGVAVHVRHPNRTTAFDVARLSNGAIATTAPYLEGAASRPGVVDPVHQEMIEFASSVTVAAPRGIWADALTKIVALRPHRCGALLRRFGADALRISSDGTATMIRGRAQSDSRWVWREAKVQT